MKVYKIYYVDNRFEYDVRGSFVQQFVSEDDAERKCAEYNATNKHDSWHYEVVEIDIDGVPCDNFNSLKVSAQANCIFEYLFSIVPYECDEYKDIEEVIEQITLTIETGLFSIDEDGNWYDEEGERV